MLRRGESGRTVDRIRFMRALVPALLLLALATPALASDGVLEISQTCAVATGCFPGDGPGFPVTISGSGSYRLTSGLEIAQASSTAVVVEAADVALDLNGFSISGPSTSGSGVGIHAPLPNGTRNRLVVRNGSVVGMGTAGILLLELDVRIENMRVASNGGPGITIGSGVVRDNIVRGNAGPGIQCDIGCTIQDNEVHENGGDGIFGEGLARGNHVADNSGIGIRFSRGFVIGNLVWSNGGIGLLLGSGVVGYGQNVVSDHTPDVSGGVNMRTNVCGSDTSCP